MRGTVAYLVLFMLLRVVLRRQAGALGITDLLVVVLVADAALNAMADDYRSVPDGLLLVAVIVGWAWVLDAASYRFRWLERLLRPRPLPLVENGELVRANMRREFVSTEELFSQLREQGIEDVELVKVARMEPDGQLSVVRQEEDQHGPRKTKAV